MPARSKSAAQRAAETFTIEWKAESLAPFERVLHAAHLLATSAGTFYDDPAVFERDLGSLKPGEAEIVLALVESWLLGAGTIAAELRADRDAPLGTASRRVADQRAKAFERLAEIDANLRARTKKMPAQLDRIRTQIRDAIETATVKEPRRFVPGVDLGEKFAVAMNPVHGAIMQLTHRAASGDPIGTNHAGYPEQRFTQNGADVALELRPSGTPEAASPDLRERVLADIYASMDERDYDTWLVVEANWILNRDEDGGAWITRNRLLAARGVKPAKRVENGKERPNGYAVRERESGGESLERLGSINITVRGPVRKRGRKLVEEQLQSRPFVVTDKRSQLQLSGFGNAETVEAWYYVPGKAVRALGTDARRVTIARAILSLDPQRHRWEKRLAQFWGNYLRPSGLTTKRIGDILETVRLSSQKNPGHDRALFTRAMNALISLGAIGGWRYADARLADEEFVGARGVGHKRWLAGSVEVSPPTLRFAPVDEP